MKIKHIEQSESGLSCEIGEGSENFTIGIPKLLNCFCIHFDIINRG